MEIALAVLFFLYPVRIFLFVAAGIKATSATQKFFFKGSSVKGFASRCARQDIKNKWEEKKKKKKRMPAKG